MPNHGDLRVWHIPQVPMQPFHVSVRSLVEARLVLNVLAEYDAFQFENRIKPDYSNVSGLEEFDATDKEDGPFGSWLEWESEYGDNIDAIDAIDLEDLDQRRLEECRQ